MPKLNRKLTDAEIRKAPLRDKEYKLYDENGLRVLIRPSGAKVWQYPFRFNGKWNIQTIGRYELVPAVDARRIRDESRQLLAKGISPNEHAKGLLVRRQEESQNSFEAIARDWYSKQVWAPKHAANILSRLQLDIFTEIGAKPIGSITRRDVLAALRKVEERGALDVAKRLSQYCTTIFDHALIEGLIDTNPAMGLAKAIKQVEHQHRAYLPANDLSGFFSALEQYTGTESVRLGMKLLFLTMVRPGELRGARWEEIDEQKREWRIPAHRMKMKREHIVPLSDQSLAVLARLRKLSGHNALVFPSRSNPRKSISDATLSKCVKMLGYKGRLQPHGARATASTILNEHDFNRDYIERQLAHVSHNKIRGAYNHALYLSQRHEMMQWWGEFLQNRGLSS